jgi:hypothetical protein
MLRYQLTFRGSRYGFPLACPIHCSIMANTSHCLMVLSFPVLLWCEAQLFQVHASILGSKDMNMTYLWCSNWNIAMIKHCLLNEIFFLLSEFSPAFPCIYTSIFNNSEVSIPIHLDMAVKKVQLYLCNIKDVSVYTNVSANYTFRPLPVRPSSGWA